MDINWEHPKYIRSIEIENIKYRVPKGIPFGTLYFIFSISILFIYFGYSQLRCINLGNYNLRRGVDMYVQMGYYIKKE